MSGQPNGKKSQSTELVELAGELFRLIVDKQRRVFVIDHSRPTIATALEGDEVKNALASSYFDRTGRTTSTAAITDALHVLAGRAARAPEQEVFLRFGRLADDTFVDLGTEDGAVVRVTGSGWVVSSASPVIFRRTPQTLALPAPRDGGTLGDLLSVVNTDEASGRLMLAWLASAVLDRAPQPILLLTGPQGSAKSTTARNVAALIDPQFAQVQTTPKSVDDWVTAAAGSAIVTLDNLSGVRPEFSDALCRIVTGDGFVKRKLYTDADPVVFSIRKSIIITSIDLGSIRGDLSERMLPIELAPIGPGRRRGDLEVAAAFEAIRPQLLGYVLDLVAAVLRRLEEPVDAGLPRMAEFGRVLHALDAEYGWTTLEDYNERIGNLSDRVVDDDPVAQAVLEILAGTRRWSGTPTELFNELQRRTSHDAGLGVRLGPRTPAQLTPALKRLGPGLGQRGVTITFTSSGRDRSKQRLVILESNEQPSPPSPDDPTRPFE